VDRGQPTQVGRALSHLGVEHIAAYSPQARGRSERLFQTLQDRLPKELALAGITTMDQANAWLRDTYIPAHNARFAIEAEQEGSAFVAVPGLDLTEILCVQEERVVGSPAPCIRSHQPATGVSITICSLRQMRLCCFFTTSLPMLLRLLCASPKMDLEAVLRLLIRMQGPQKLDLNLVIDQVEIPAIDIPLPRKL